MKTPDSHTTKLGSKDFVFQVNKWPFAITCNPLLPTITESFIDLALVMDMKINMKKVECRNISYGGLSTKLVGTISQTVQVVYDGVPSGTLHLKAKVIRNLTNLYGVDCIAGQKLYKTLTTNGEASLDTLNSSAVSSVSSIAGDVASDTLGDDNTADDLVFKDDDSPKTRKKKRKNRFMVANVSFTDSMLSSPPGTPRSSTPAAATEQVQNSMASLTSPPPGFAIGSPERQEPSPVLQNPPQMLTDSILCGHAPPCSCVELFRAQQLHLLPPLYPVYLPVDHQPCGLACASHHVHGDNLHPPDPSLCLCDPPRVQPGYVRGRDVHLQYVPLAQGSPPPVANPKTEKKVPDTSIYVQTLASSKLSCLDCGEQFSVCQGNCPESRIFQHISSVGQDDEPPLPPDFQPCGSYCGYQICQCLRNYEGRDWAS